MKTNQALAWRYATKQFDPEKKLNEEEIALALETLRMAPSSYGLQPWRFYLVEDEQTRAAIRTLAWDQAQVTDASHLIAIAGKTQVTEEDVHAFMRDMKETRGVGDADIAGYCDMILQTVRSLSTEQNGVWCSRQAYLALGFLLATLAHNGIDACPMEGFDAEKVSALLKATDDGYHVVTLVPIGHRAQADTYAALPKVRFSQEQIVKRV